MTGEVKRHNVQTNIPVPSKATPTWVFSLLLILVILVTAAERLLHWSKPAQVMDILLLTGQTIIGIILLYMSVAANLFGTHLNWYLIPFNPIPVILWVLFHRNKSLGTIYLIYTIILLTFIMLTPFLSQLDIPHQLIVASFVVRTTSHYLQNKEKNVVTKMHE